MSNLESRWREFRAAVEGRPKTLQWTMATPRRPSALQQLADMPEDEFMRRCAPEKRLETVGKALGVHGPHLARGSAPPVPRDRVQDLESMSGAEFDRKFETIWRKNS